MIDHAAGAAHDRFQVRHQEGDVIESVDRRFREYDGMVIAVAAQERHQLRAVGEAKAEHLLVERRELFDVGAVDVDVGEPLGTVSHDARRLGAIAMDELHAAALRFTDDEVFAA